MVEAAREMRRGLDLTAAHCRNASIPVDASLDPNGTCLIGPSYTPLFTTLGQLEAKRTVLDPDVAGVLAHLLERAGVGSGDRVAVGASGSFPGLLIATLAAVSALEASPVTILSLGASSYGATRPGFHLLDLYGVLQEGGLVSGSPAAVSLGGADDVGREFPEELALRLQAEVRESGAFFLDDPDLASNVDHRMEIYQSPKVFVNIGGSDANIGTDPVILQIPPGLVDPRDLPGEREIPPPPRRGVLLEMAARGVPVIHLLHVRGLTQAYGLPWDPIPLPDPATTPLKREDSAEGWSFWLLTAAFLGTLAGIFLVHGAGKPSAP
jgi:poly-gamma-glutamate system protein